MRRPHLLILCHNVKSSTSSFQSYSTTLSIFYVTRMARSGIVVLFRNRGSHALENTFSPTSTSMSPRTWNHRKPRFSTCYAKTLLIDCPCAIAAAGTGEVCLLSVFLLPALNGEHQRGDAEQTMVSLVLLHRFSPILKSLCMFSVVVPHSSVV